jgi:hypothetical protein
MQRWSNRAVEEANLFNPAFCAVLLAETSKDFIGKASRPLPFALAFLVLPIVLHRSTREALPGSTVTSLLPWIQDNREHLVNFSTRVRRLTAIGREAILFGVQTEALSLGADGALALGPKRRSVTPRRTPFFTAEARECTERAGFVGRWFAVAGSTATIYASWGITP